MEMNKLNITRVNENVKTWDMEIEMSRWQTVEDMAKMLNGILRDNVVVSFDAKRKGAMKTILTVKVKEEEVVEKAVVLAKGKGIGKSQYRGVFWDKNNFKWRVMVQKEGKRTHVGRYFNEVHAAMAYDKAAYDLNGLNGYFNFPETIEAYHNSIIGVEI